MHRHLRNYSRGFASSFFVAERFLQAIKSDAAHYEVECRHLSLLRPQYSSASAKLAYQGGSEPLVTLHV
jgi:hypothetical protein